MLSTFLLTNKKPYSPSQGVWFFVFSLLCILLVFSACTKDEPAKQASLMLKTGTAYSANGAYIPVGGSIKIGVLASGAGTALTYVHIDKIAGKDTVVELDRGVFIGSEGLDADYIFTKDTSTVEIWRVLVMNADRDTAMRMLTFHKASGTSYQPIHSFDSIRLSFQNSDVYGHFLDVHTGKVYGSANISGHEGDIDVLVYYYVTSGLPSPTLICPGYVPVVAYYPSLSGWPVRNNILYDYYTSDNNLISTQQFDAAQNDSLLVSAFRPAKVSSNSKYAYTGKVVPFKTQEGRYGLLKVKYADEKDDGMIEMAIKIQQ